MRQVDRDELLYVIASALRDLPASLLSALKHHSHAERDRTRVIIARRVAQEMARWEILTSAPAAPEATFSRPVARMLGEDTESGAPRID